MSYITGTIRLFSYSPRICRYDNGTSICDKGFSLNQIGRCVSQSLGKWNSTGFLPTYPICLTDYVSILNSYLLLYTSSSSIVSSTKQISDPGPGNITGYFYIFKESSISNSANEIQFSPSLSGYTTLYQTSNLKTISSNILVVPEGIESQYIFHHAGKNVVPHLTNVSSEYWVVDTYSTAKISKRYNQIDTDVVICGFTKPHSSSYIISSDVHIEGISNPYKALSGDFGLPLGYTLLSGEEAENPVSICVDDLTCPVVSGESPARSSHLNRVDSYIEFKVIDSVGGVDIGLLKVLVSGTETVPPLGPIVVSSGVDVTGGDVSITGDAYEYTIRYIPPVDWFPGETIHVTVSGQDREPTYDSVPWSCYDQDIRNVFGSSYVFNVATSSDLLSSIVVIPDASAPYLTNISPGKYTRDNDAYTTVRFDIIDDVSGVERVSLNISVDNVEIVGSGQVVTSEASIDLLSNGYRITYTPTTRFTYGRNIIVSVSAQDQYLLSPNSFTDIYNFSIIADSSLAIENFTPEENSSYLAATKYLCVDVSDSSFGIKDAYFIINGTTYSGSRSLIYGNMSLYTAISGTTEINAGLLTGATISGVGITGCFVDGDAVLSGTIVSGSVASGTMSGFAAPFGELGTCGVVSAELFGGTVVSGLSLDTLVSGVNWDGRYVGASVYDITISGALLTNTVSSGTVVSGETGFTMCARPESDYDYQGVITTVVHAENKNPLSRVIKNESYRLYRGYRVLEHRYDMDYNSVVSVFSRAINKALFSNSLSSAYQFRTHNQPRSDISANIVPRICISDLGANIQITSPTYSYGEVITVELYLEDKAGNVLGPYTFTYTIENA
jgi:hypothetical protein